MAPLAQVLNNLAGTTGLDEQGAANALAGTGGLATQGALNKYVGTSGLGIEGCLNLMAGTSGLAQDAAMSRIVPSSGLELHLDASRVDGWPTDGPLSKNLLSYNQATVETDTTGLSVLSNCTIARVTSQFLGGAASLSMTSAAGGDMDAGLIIGTGNVSVVPGITYTGVLSSRSAALARTAAVLIVWYDSASAFISTSAGTGTVNSTSAWTAHSVTAVAPATAAFATIRCRVTATAAAAEIHYIDNLGLWEGPTTDWIAPGFKNTKNLLTYNQATVETDTTGLSSLTNCNIARVTSQFLGGLASLSLTSVAGGNMAAGLIIGTGNVAVVPGVTYTGVVSSRSAVSARTAEAIIVWYDSASAFISTGTGTGTVNSTSGWTAHSITAVSPATAAFATIRLQVDATAAASEVHYADNFGLWRGSSQAWNPPYRGTALTDGTAIDYWRDLSGKERSVVQYTAAKQPKLRRANPNRFTFNQASAETDLLGFTAGANTTHAVSTTFALHGRSSLQVTAVGAGDTFSYSTSSPTSYLVPITGGATYTAEVSSRAATTGRNFNIAIEWRDSSFSYISGGAGANVADAVGSWTRNSFTGPAPANAAYAGIYVQIIAQGVAEVHYLDCLGFYDGTLPSAWSAPVKPGATRAAVQFDGLDDRMETLTKVLVPQPSTIYVVATPDGPVSGGQYVWSSHPAQTARSDLLLGGAVYKPQATTPLDSTVTAVAGTTAVVSFVANGTSSKVAVNGGAAVVGDAGVIGFDMVTIGDRFASSGTSNWEGNISAFLVYSVAHTDAQRKVIEQALGNAYGVAVAP